MDIEGTTTPIDFVHNILFPFARERVRDYLNQNWASPDLEKDLVSLRDEHEHDIRQGLEPPEITTDRMVAYIHWLIDQDRKSTPLKSLQGKIWEEGYLTGELLAPVFDDVAPALKRWTKENKQICIYSSGSIPAQRLLFSHTTRGDLTKYIFRYFDTTIGSKVDTSSYLRIAAELQLPPAEIVFISDAIAELDAARSAGLRTVLSVRPGNKPLSASVVHPQIKNF
ncbi:MAG: acireductone synthase [Acidobacteria bacterium]|nr:acireductone synthase [Acidobacteriota bacterium]